MVAKSVLSQLQSVGEGALGKLAQSPATRTALKGAVQAKERGERLLHSLDSIETRLGQIEERLSALEKPKRRRSSPAAGAPAAEPNPPDAAAAPGS